MCLHVAVTSAEARARRCQSPIHGQLGTAPSLHNIGPPNRRISMRTTFWVSMVAAALLSGAGCKKKDESGKAMDKAATSAAKAQEDVREQAKDVANEQKDVAKEQKDVNKEQTDVAKQQGELNAAKDDLAQARERYNVAAKQRLQNLDAKTHEIEMRTDAAAKD